MVLRIYMKSGNVIRLGGIKSWKFSSVGNSVSSITIKPTWISNNFKSNQILIVSTIDLSQIEAVTESWF